MTSIDRLSWWELPCAIRAATETGLGAHVVGEDRHVRGNSAGLASTLTLSDAHRRVFVKAICPSRDPETPGLFRKEIAVNEALPARVPAPRMLWSYDDGEWVALAFEHVEGRHPVEPWSPDELALVIERIDESTETLEPSQAIPHAADDLADSFGAWTRIAADPSMVDRLPEWPRANVERLVEWETGWKPAVTGSTLAHTDLRADNLLITADSEVTIVDWPWAVVGAAWLDLLFLLPSVLASGGRKLDPQQVWMSSAVGRMADPEAVTTAIAALAGDYLASSLRPVPRHNPRLRAAQAARAAAAMRWFQSRIA